MAIVTQALAECSIADVTHASVAALRGWLNDQDDRLVELGELLRDANYRFTTITPTSHAQNLRRRWDEQTCTLHNVFGWNRPFPHGALPEPYLSLLRRSGSLQQCGNRYVSTVRFSTLSDLVLMHSAYPTSSVDSVFFGPDTYRFAREIIRALSTFATAPSVIADIGCGSGAGGLVASSFLVFRH